MAMAEQATPSWTKSEVSHLFVFNVGRGLCVFIRTPTNHGILYDLGTTDGFTPTDFLRDKIIPHLTKYKGNDLAQIVISHPHSDHISGIDALKAKEKAKDEAEKADPPITCGLLTLPNAHDKTVEEEKVDWTRVNNREGSESLVETYKEIYKDRTPPLQTLHEWEGKTVGDVAYAIYYVSPTVVAEECPTDDQAYTNGLSIVLWYRHSQFTALVPGDVTPEMLKKILNDEEGVQKRYSPIGKDVETNGTLYKETGKQRSLRDRFKKIRQPTGVEKKAKVMGLSILVAPHHGLESGYSEDLSKAVKPQLVVISEKVHDGKNDGTVDARYQCKEAAQSLTVKISGTDKKDCYSISTRGYHILIKFSTGLGVPEVFQEPDPEDLLKWM
jgi:beta-lactamase superfamily II metal-dependent hydrolase